MNFLEMYRITGIGYYMSRYCNLYWLAPEKKHSGPLRNLMLQRTNQQFTRKCATISLPLAVALAGREEEDLFWCWLARNYAMYMCTLRHANAFILGSPWRAVISLAVNSITCCVCDCVCMRVCIAFSCCNLCTFRSNFPAALGQIGFSCGLCVRLCVGLRNATCNMNTHK